jgi:hypothetical protein
LVFSWFIPKPSILRKEKKSYPNNIPVEGDVRIVTSKNTQIQMFAGKRKADLAATKLNSVQKRQSGHIQIEYEQPIQRNSTESLRSASTASSAQVSNRVFSSFPPPPSSSSSSSSSFSSSSFSSSASSRDAPYATKTASINQKPNSLPSQPQQSFADVMRRRSSGAEKLSKAQKKKMRKKWRKAKKRRARGLPSEDEEDEGTGNQNKGDNGTTRLRIKKMQDQSKSHQSPKNNSSEDNQHRVWVCIINLLKARGSAVRQLGRLLHTDWTGEQMQRVMILYGHIFWMAVVSNIFAAKEEANQANLNNNTALPVAILLIIAGTLFRLPNAQNLIMARNLASTNTTFVQFWTPKR